MEYPLAFGNGNREVRLSGEAYFEVARDELRHFNVIMEGATVEVTGTSFRSLVTRRKGNVVRYWKVVRSIY